MILTTNSEIEINFQASASQCRYESKTKFLRLLYQDMCRWGGDRIDQAWIFWSTLWIIAGVQLHQPGIQPEEMSSVSERFEAASQFSWTSCLFQAYDSLLYFYKSIRSEVWYFQFPLTQICCLHKSLLPFKRSFCLSDSLIYFFSCVLVNTLQLMLILGFIPHSSV